MDTYNTVVRAKEGEPGAGWKRAKGAKMGDISHSFNNQVFKKLAYDFYTKKSFQFFTLRQVGHNSYKYLLAALTPNTVQT